MAQCSLLSSLSSLVSGEQMTIFPPRRFRPRRPERGDGSGRRRRSARRRRSLSKNLLWQNSDIRMVCVFVFCCEGPICIHMNISIYIFFKAFLYVSKLLFNVCVSWKTWCCMCALQAYSSERHNVVYHVVSPVFFPPFSQ